MENWISAAIFVTLFVLVVVVGLATDGDAKRELRTLSREHPLVALALSVAAIAYSVVLFIHLGTGGSLGF